MAAMPADQRRTDWFDDVLKKQSLSFSELTDIVVESKLFSVDQLWQEAKASCGRRDFAVRDLRRCGLSSSQRMLGHLTQLAQCGGNVSSVEDTPYSTGNSYGGLEMVGYPKSPWVSILKCTKSWSNSGWFGVALFGLETSNCYPQGISQGLNQHFFSDASNDGDLSLKKLGYHWDLISRVKPSRNGVTIWLFNIAMENHLF